MKSSVGQQMPQLFLRGSLCNVTMRNLTQDEVKEIGAIVEMVQNDPLMQPCRAQFKSALANTISGDYRSDKDLTAEQEFLVAIWRAAVAAVKGWGTQVKHPPCPATLTDPIQRKKFFQTWAFNYLRQILLENKRQMYTTTHTEMVQPVEALRHHVQKLLGDEAKISTIEGGFKVATDLYIYPSYIIQQLTDLVTKYLSKRVQIALDDTSITVHKAGSSGEEEVESSVDTRVRTVSTCQSDDDGPGVEVTSGMEPQIGDTDTMSAYFDSLSDKAKEIMSVILNPPDAYIDKYKTAKPVQKYIAEYLKVKPKEIKALYEEMRIKYAQIVGKPG